MLLENNLKNSYVNLRLNLAEFKQLQNKPITFKFNIRMYKNRLDNLKANGYKQEVNSYA